MAGSICTDGPRRGHVRAAARERTDRHGRRVGPQPPNPADGFAVGAPQRRKTSAKPSAGLGTTPRPPSGPDNASRGTPAASMRCLPLSVRDRHPYHPPAAALIIEAYRLDRIRLVGETRAELDDLIAVRRGGQFLLADQCAGYDRAQWRAHL